jgi:hypothetical protein
MLAMAYVLHIGEKFGPNFIHMQYSMKSFDVTKKVRMQGGRWDP